ncbi:unnamed protein product [Urochloa decumbens]|uniref:Uncharacterized protein n=1 Tax=Urochloa decumbens TaxID=240449 RepID=A0ABC9AB55_9POAL
MAPPSRYHDNRLPTPQQNGGVVVVPAEEETEAPLPQCENQLDPDEFRRQGHQVIDFIADYYARMGDYPVHPSVTPGFLHRQLPDHAPSRPEPHAFAAALQDVRDLILPGLTHWQSPRHFAHFPASSSTVGALGEALIAGINVVPFTWAASPAATELEMVVVDWLGKALHLPGSLLFGGGGGGTLLGTSCEAILCTLVAARDRKLADIAARSSGKGIEDLVVYCSDQTHFAFHKAARIAGIRRENCRSVATRRGDMFALSPADLDAAMRADVDAGMVPLFVCATVGTTQTGAVDPVRELCAVAAAHGAWVHVDAAYAGSALVCPEFGHVIDGAEAVDSFSMNAHKWLLANTDCCALWVARPAALVAALGTEQEYILKDAAAAGHDVVDYKDWSITLTRRFRALKLWLVLRVYGVEGLRDHVRSHVRMAAAFEGMVRDDARFEVVVTRWFSLVCFRLRSPESLGGEKAANELNRRLLEEVNNATGGGSGAPYMSSAMVGGVYMLRCAVGSTLTEDRHVREAWKVVQDRAASLLRKMEIIACWEVANQ